MKLFQAKKIARLITESVAPGSLYRVMDIDEFYNIIKGKWDFISGSIENEDIDDNGLNNNKKDQKRLKNSLVYNLNDKIDYNKSFTRSINPGLMENHFDPDFNVIIDFDRSALSDLRNLKVTPIDYQPYGKGYKGGAEMEDRFYSPDKSIKLNLKKPDLSNIPDYKKISKNPQKALNQKKPRGYKLNKLIRAIYYPEQLASERPGDIGALKKLGIPVGIIPKMKNYKKLTSFALKQLLKK